MKLAMNERLKHRLTGVVVIVSAAIIFVPLMMKRSNQRFEENITMSLNLPRKPLPPKVAIPNQETMFQTVKVARVEIPSLPVSRQTAQIAKAAPISSKPLNHQQIRVAKAEPVAKALVKTKVLAAAPAKAAIVSKPSSVAVVRAPIVALKTKPVFAESAKKGVFAIQLASFTQQNNAESLVSRLRSQGYSASFNKSTSKNGDFYKVLVGQLNQRDEAVNLQKKLVTNMQLNGFIVRTG